MYYFFTDWISRPADRETEETASAAKLESSETNPSRECPKMGFGFVSYYAVERHPSAQTAPHGPVDQGSAGPQSDCDASLPQPRKMRHKISIFIRNI